MSLRVKIGWAAVALLTIALISYPLASWGWVRMPVAAAMRLGIVLCLLWLAWNDLARCPKWLYLSILVTAVVAAICPWSLLAIVPAVLLVLYFRPRSPQVPRRVPPPSLPHSQP